MDAEKIKIVFADYLKLSDPKYALLLNGSWGGGKTFFWKNELLPIVKEQNLHPVYISLNGISKIEHLEQELFLRMLPYINKEKAAKILRPLANGISKLFLRSSIDELLKGVSLSSQDYSSHFLCFDDLERTPIPYQEVLGFINNFVEHKYLKALILADEAKILAEPNKYSGIKEKVIGRIFNYRVQIEQVLPQIFLKYKADGDYFDWLNKSRSFIERHLIEFKQHNLRITDFFLSILQKLFTTLKVYPQSLQEEITFFALTICIEFKHGQLQSSDVDDSKGLSDFSMLDYERSLKNEHNNGGDAVKPLEYREIFATKYLTFHKEQYHFYGSIYRFVLSGFLDESALRNEVKERLPKQQPPHVVAFNTLLKYNFRNLENDEFEQLSAAVFEHSKQGLYSIYDYVQIADYYHYFSENGLVEIAEQEIINFIDQGLSIAKNRREINDHVFSNLMHFERSFKVEAVKRKVREIHFEIKKHQTSERSNELVNAIALNDVEKVQEIFENNRMDKELITTIDITEFAKALLNCKNEVIERVSRHLSERYNSQNIGQFLGDDQANMLELSKLLDSASAASKGQPKSFLLKSLSEDVKGYLSRLSTTKV